MRRNAIVLLVLSLLAVGLVIGRASGGSPCVDDNLEDDDTVAQANELDATTPIVAVSCPGDPDVFDIFLLEHSGPYTVTVTPVGSADVALDRLDDDGIVLDEKDDGLSGDPESHGTGGYTIDQTVHYRVRTAIGAGGGYAISVTGSVAPIAISSLGVAVTDNFDWLDPDSEASTVGTGWMFRELTDSPGTTPRANFLYMPSDGTDPEGDTYSFGTGTLTDRAFGSIGKGVATLRPNIYGLFRNKTGSTIDSIALSYDGETWRDGDATVTDRIDFAFRQVFGSFSDVNSLDYSTVNALAATGALDGNAAANRATVSSTIGGLNIPDGGRFVLRWSDADVSGAEDGLGIDELSVTGSFTPPPPDEDGDGVPDANDACPGTPAGREVDADGCEKDDDDDGVVNDVDACPSTPPGDGVGPDGCSFNVHVTIAKGKGTVFNDPDASEINCGLSFADCDERYPSDETVTLKAKPKRGWRFVKWGNTGACAPLKTKTCTTAVNGDLEVQAIFRKR